MTTLLPHYSTLINHTEFCKLTFGGVEAKLVYFASASLSFFLTPSNSSSSWFLVLRWSLFALCTSCSKLWIFFLRSALSSCNEKSCLSFSLLLFWGQIKIELSYGQVWVLAPVLAREYQQIPFDLHLYGCLKLVCTAYEMGRQPTNQSLNFSFADTHNGY